MNPNDRDFLAFEALAHEIADTASEEDIDDPRLTAAGDMKLAEMIEAKLAGMKAARLTQARAERLAAKPVTIRPGLLAMARAALQERLNALQAMVPEGLAAQHRHLGEVSDDDLRSMIADLEALIPGANDGAE